MIIQWLIVLPIVAALLWLANGIRLIGTVSKGYPIGHRPNTAVLMVDLQTVFWDSDQFSEDDKLNAQTAIFDEVNNAKENGLPIIAIRQEWSILSTQVLSRLTMGGAAIAGTKGTEVAEPFSDLSDHTLVKRVQDSFETGELDKLLEELQVGTLRIVGLDARYCVDKTAKAALGRGYNVELIEKAILAAEPKKGKEVLKTLAQNGAVLR
ncbi:isochorismatase family protein [Vibrio penaeicida]|uniref:isochorismatase family protein n=1 Tax=Vibrio penaeicida TaxID=104609 RepID=UPI002736BB71|nr:isochorismatase family protein [Vibrio penaeicida]MDP2571830.1 isochorismatase family protein [Vibrio penaeicida]